MNSINYNGKKFRSVANTDNGEVTAQTIFSYHQHGNLIWVEYEGGKILLGRMIGILLPDGKLEFRYQHINDAQELMTGICLSTPEILPDGRVQLRESWTWTCDDYSSGESVVEEILFL